VLDVDNVVWCTGFTAGLEWLTLPVRDDAGHLRQYRGVVEGETGLYVVGMAYQHAPSSAMIHGVGRDARRVAEAILARITKHAIAA